MTRLKNDTFARAKVENGWGDLEGGDAQWTIVDKPTISVSEMVWLDAEAPYYRLNPDKTLRARYFLAIKRAEEQIKLYERLHQEMCQRIMRWHKNATPSMKRAYRDLFAKRANLF